MLTGHQDAGGGGGGGGGGGELHMTSAMVREDTEKGDVAVQMYQVLFQTSQAELSWLSAKYPLLGSSPLKLQTTTFLK